ncbi:hypothetical protein DL93DRAFT_2075474 [Clavulina sp. PMI_390]|nr:hypothetical protein DL93DRAFT_2075474 [Clavulina sp. PMI_390]
MSGCAVCVYDLYIEAKAAYSTALSNALTELREQDVPREDWPAEVIALDAKLNSSGSKSGAAVDSSAVFEDEGPLDATLRAFMELEKKLKSTG